MISAAWGTSKTTHPDPVAPGAMFSVAGNDAHAVALSMANSFDRPEESTTSAPLDGPSEYAAGPVMR